MPKTLTPRTKPRFRGVKIDHELDRQIRFLAATRDVPISDVLRAALVCYVEQELATA